ncbi:hypothetical protein [uncultured Ferrovibrio sp.]|jgi:hypothetical protein|uniref:hypothetical protein n=1 Tax=uncultured Ferrovibrio sp. TaxID=1576913 RepID=UPI00261863FE|nr:hypothetical protein [uncultured Ferrovibrio sp.]
MGAHAEIVVPRYVVLTRLADSWIPRASHANPETAEAEAFRWRRIYGPAHTRVAEYWVPERPHHRVATAAPTTLPAPLNLSATDLPVVSATVLPVAAKCDCLPWRETALRAFGLYLGFCLADRALELLILLAG